MSVNAKTILRRVGHLLTRNWRLRSVGRMVVLAAVVGVVAGVGAIAFHWLCDEVAHYALEVGAGYHEMDPSASAGASASRTLRPWLLAIIPALGGLGAGLLIFKFAPEAKGSGTGTAIGAYHDNCGNIRGRVGLVKILASAITLGTGGSGGREGPIALVGASCGSYLARRFGLSRRERRVLLVAGMGAGIGALFKAPLAGAIFAVEVLYTDPDFEAESLIPAFFATTIAYCVFSRAFGVAPVFQLAALPKFNQPLLLLPLTVLAGVIVVVAFVYVTCLHRSQLLFDRLSLPRYVKPAIGALAAGVMTVAIYYSLAYMGSSAQRDSLGILGYGYGFLQKLMSGGAGIIVPLLIIVALGKILTTSLTIGSGGSGGVFGPSIVIGGSVGAVVGLLFQAWMPLVVIRVEVFVILGAAGFFTAAANTPVSTLIMVSEMTGSHAMLLPSMWVCGLSYLLGRGYSLYAQQVTNRTKSPAHRGELIVDVLLGATVADVWSGPDEEMVTVPHDALLSKVAVWVTGTRQSCFPVVDENNLMCGYFSLDDIRYYVYDQVAGEMVDAQTLAATDVEPLTPETDLTFAMSRFAQTSYNELPIANSDSPRKVVALLRRRDIIALYNSRLEESRSEEA